jgi:hypothetical protein
LVGSNAHWLNECPWQLNESVVFGADENYFACLVGTDGNGAVQTR